MRFELWPIIYLIIAICLMVILCCVIPRMKVGKYAESDVTLDSSHQSTNNFESSCSKETNFQMKRIKSNPSEYFA